MKVHRFFSFFVFLWVSFFIIGCGGGGSSGSSSSSSSSETSRTVSPGGVWEGFQAIDGEPDIEIAGLVTEDGRFHFLREDGAQAVGSISVSVNRGQADYRIKVEAGDAFVDGSVAADGILDVQIEERSSIRGRFSSVTDGGLREEGTIQLTYNDIYDRPSSISTASGIFMERDFDNMIIIDDQGRVEYKNISESPTCIADGVIEPFDQRFNAYDISFRFEGCDGEVENLNNVLFSGIAYLDNQSEPEELVIGVVGNFENFDVFVVDFFDRQ